MNKAKKELIKSGIDLLIEVGIGLGCLWVISKTNNDYEAIVVLMLYLIYSKVGGEKHE
jgi:hypothetical protein